MCTLTHIPGCVSPPLPPHPPQSSRTPPTPPPSHKHTQTHHQTPTAERLRGELESKRTHMGGVIRDIEGLRERLQGEAGQVRACLCVGLCVWGGMYERGDGGMTEGREGGRGGREGQGGACKLASLSKSQSTATWATSGSAKWPACLRVAVATGLAPGLSTCGCCQVW